MIREALLHVHDDERRPQKELAGSRTPLPPSPGGAGPGKEMSMPPSSAPPETGGRVRLNKYLAGSGLCSRRAADALMGAGRVSVNGRPAGPGTMVDPDSDDVRLDGEPIPRSAAARGGHFYIMLNKPVQVVTTARDPQGRQTALDLVADAARGRRLFPVGRLDYFSEGLLILTTDGELANRLMHPRYNHPKLYLVTVRGEVPERALAAMRQGMTLAEGERLAPVKARLIRKDARQSVVEMELVQGVNRQIRRMCRDLGLTILKLVRVAQGPLKLEKLASGSHRPLDRDEVAALRRVVGLA
jgi:23S rRNA pseudouridine2605 synthase